MTMIKSITALVAGAALYLAPVPSYANGPIKIGGGKCAYVQPCPENNPLQSSSSGKPVAAAAAKETKAGMIQPAPSPSHDHPHRHADYEATLRKLTKKLKKIDEQLGTHYNDELALHGVITGRLNTNERLMGEIVESMVGLLTRIETYEGRVDSLYHNQVLDQARNTFQQGMQELTARRDAMIKACVSTAENQSSPREGTLACRGAQRDYDAKQAEFDRRVHNNIFGRNRDARRAWFELGAQGRYEPQGAAAGAVTGAVTYRGDRVTVGLGLGAGYGGDAASTVDLTQAPASEPQGEYTQLSSQTGTERTADRYRGHLQLRAATPDLDVSRRWAMQVGGIAELVASERTETVDRTRTVQFLSGDQPVGRPHSAPGVETEQSTHYSTIVGMAFDFLHDQNRDGRAIGVRLTGGYNVTDARANATLGVVGRY